MGYLLTHNTSDILIDDSSNNLTDVAPTPGDIAQPLFITALPGTFDLSGKDAALAGTFQRAFSIAANVGSFTVSNLTPTQLKFGEFVVRFRHRRV